jgi:hypothetical protein
MNLYDYNLQQKIFNQIYPAHEAFYGPSPYPPYVALFFRPFARVSFESAYLLWMGISLALYIAGIAAAVKEVFPRERLKISLIFCFALAFYPFVFGTLLNGQLASVAVFSIGLAIFQERHSNPFCSGLALSILAYKPTLLFLLLPMLLLTRRSKTLFGFIFGTVILIVVATAFTGIQIWPTYAHMLRPLWTFRGTPRSIGPSTMEIYRLCLIVIRDSRRPIQSWSGDYNLLNKCDCTRACGVVVEVGDRRQVCAIFGLGGDSDMDLDGKCLCPDLRLSPGRNRGRSNSWSTKRS